MLYLMVGFLYYVGSGLHFLLRHSVQVRSKQYCKTNIVITHEIVNPQHCCSSCC